MEAAGSCRGGDLDADLVGLAVGWGISGQTTTTIGGIVWLGSPDLRDTLRREARNTIETSFNSSTTVDGIEQILYAARNTCVPCPN